MNYYEHHIGDYEADTAHLSLVEDAIYSRIIRRYYRQEGPLPTNPESVARLIRAADQVEIVKSVLLEFFTLADDGWHHNRCDQEIERYRDKRSKARASASASVESRRRTSADIRSERMTAAKQKGTHTREEWEALREFCGHKCVKCGAEGHQDRDHIIPVYQGGSDAIDNIQPLCARCNAGKGPERVDYRPSGWQAFVERSLSGRSTHQTPDTKHQTPEKQKPPVVPKGDAESDAVLDAYHHALPKCQQIFVVNEKRKKRIAAAVKLARQVSAQQGWPWSAESFWAAYFAECATDPWMRGEVANPKNPNWKQNLDVLLAEDRFAAVMDKAIASMRKEAA